MNNCQKHIRCVSCVVLLCLVFTTHAIEGRWVGVLKPGGDTELPIGLEVITRADGKKSANVSITAQNARYLPNKSVQISQEAIIVQLAGLPIEIEATATEDNNRLNGLFKQGNVELPLPFNRVDKIPEPGKPQTPKSTDGYSTQEVSIHQVQDDVYLSATLSKPKGEQKFSAVLLLPGSGPTDRDVYHGGHRPFLVMADHLTRAGFVVLRADKRGVHKSTGDFSTADIDDLVRDGQALLDYLQKHPAVDRKRIHVLGHSEGSLIAAQLAADNSLIQSVISLAGPGLDAKEVLLMQDYDAAIAAGATDEDATLVLAFSKQFYAAVLAHQNVESRRQALNQLYESLAEQSVLNQYNKRQGTLNVDYASTDAFLKLLKLQPGKVWQQVDAATLIVNGLKDQQVRPMDNTQAIKQSLQEGGNAKVTIKLYEHINHMLQTAESGAPSNYADLPETIAPIVLNDIVAWLLEYN